MRQVSSATVQDELRRGRESLRAAQTLVKSRCYADAVSRAYYAILHAAKAALLTCHVRVDSHAGAIGMFGLHLVKPGLIEKSYAQTFLDQEEDRIRSDYDVDFTFDAELACQRVEEAEQFLKRIEQFLNEQPST